MAGCGCFPSPESTVSNFVQGFFGFNFPLYEHGFPVEICLHATIGEFLVHFWSHMGSLWQAAAASLLLNQPFRILFKGFLVLIFLSMNMGFLLRFVCTQQLVNFWFIFGLIWARYG